MKGGLCHGYFHKHGHGNPKNERKNRFVCFMDSTPEKKKHLL